MKNYKDYDKILEDLVATLSNDGLLIGSRKFGGSSSHSDWDYVISDFHQRFIWWALNETEIDWWMLNGYGYGDMYYEYNIKFNHNGNEYNVFIYTDERFRIIKENLRWFNTGKSEMTTYMNSNKKARAYIFNGFLHSLFGPETKPFECNEANRIPCIKLDLDNTMIWLCND